MKMTDKQKFILNILKDRDSESYSICMDARRAGLNTRSLASEWADGPLRQLRQAGLVEYTGEFERFRKVHRITPAGRHALCIAEA